MTPEQQKEEISKAYVHAVAARHGFKIGTWSTDDGCLDVTIGAAGTLGGGTIGNPKIDLQLKCTSQKRLVKPGYVSWQLDGDHYRRLVAPSSTPHLLVVLVLPEDSAKWIEHSVQRLLLRRCAYWLKMTGRSTSSQASKTVRLPKTQVFSPDELLAMMTKISSTGTL